MMNIFTVDVEEYYHAENILNSISRENLNRLSSRVDVGVDKILKLLKKTGNKATFFVLGCVAEKHKSLIRQIAKDGHEIASHGYEHIPLYKHTAESFEMDLKKSMDILSGLAGEKILGYRATSFSISEKSPWFCEVLKKCEIIYDSSMALSLFRPSPTEIRNRLTNEKGQEVLEFPVSFGVAGPFRIPQGGGYFRIYPYWLSKWALEHSHTNGHQMTLFYIHPWELDPGQPRLSISPDKYLRHYLNLSGTEEKLARLLQDMKFTSVKEVLKEPHFTATPL